MAEQRGRSSTGIAFREADGRAIAKYLTSLKPVLANPTDARTVWVRVLNELAHRDDLAGAQAEAVQVALGQGHQFNEARRQLNAVIAPHGCEQVQRALDSWLKTMAESCDSIVRAPTPLHAAAIEKARDLLHDAAREADKFNLQREAIVMSLQEAAAPSSERPRFIVNKKEMRGLILGLVGLLVAFGGLICGLSALSSPSALPTPTVSPSTGERRVYKQSDMLARLRQEVNNRIVQYNDVDVRLVPPDRIIVPGKIVGSNDLIPVEVELQIGVEAGKPKITPLKISSAGVISVPQSAIDALNKRADEGNVELAKQLQPGDVVRRVFIQDDAVVVEFEPKPGAGGTPVIPAKPGG